MATDQRSLPAFFNTDADFQAWVQGLQAQFAACGLVRTSDTGQINSATVAKPAAANTSQGYEIYRFSDSAQATLPFFFKIEYGSGATAADRPSLWLTSGMGSGGNGVIEGGNFVSRIQMMANASKTAGATLTSYCSGDGGRIALITNYDRDLTTFGFGFVMGRSCDAGGAVTGEATFTMTTSADTTNRSSFQVVFALSAYFRQTFGSASSPNVPGPHCGSSTATLGSGFTSWGGRVGVIPFMMILGQLRFCVAGGYYATADMPAGGLVQVINLGSTRSYLFLPSLAGPNSIQADSIAILWE